MLRLHFFSNRKASNQESTGHESAGTSEDIQCNKAVKKKLRIRVVVADDHPVMRNGLSGIITKQEDMEVIGQAADGEEAVKVTLQVKPDVVLMDVIMPVLDGIGATRKIISERPETRVIGLTMYADPATETQMRFAGATRCLTKSCPTEVLLAAIRSASGQFEEL